MPTEIHIVLKIEVLNLSKQLKVFDISSTPGPPEEEQRLQGRRGKPPLSSKILLPGKLNPIAGKIWEALSKALFQRLYARVCDATSADPSPTAMPPHSPLRRNTSVQTSDGLKMMWKFWAATRRSGRDEKPLGLLDRYQHESLDICDRAA